MSDETNPKDLLGILKPDLSLIPPAGLIYEALAMMDGKAKYGAYNWRTKKVQSMIYLAASLRHHMAIIEGEWIDPLSKRPHVGHARACLGILADAYEGGFLLDTRPPKGPGAELIRNLTIESGNK